MFLTTVSYDNEHRVYILYVNDVPTYPNKQMNIFVILPDDATVLL